MSYTPTNWQRGDKITSEKLNRIEGGIASAILFANVDTSTATLDKTWQEIASADVAYVIMANARLTMKIPVVATIADASNNAYYVGAVGVAEATGEGNETEFELTQYTFKATSADGFPVFAI